MIPPRPQRTKRLFIGQKLFATMLLLSSFGGMLGLVHVIPSVTAFEIRHGSVVFSMKLSRRNDPTRMCSSSNRRTGTKSMPTTTTTGSSYVRTNLVPWEESGEVTKPPSPPSSMTTAVVRTITKATGIMFTAFILLTATGTTTTTTTTTTTGGWSTWIQPALAYTPTDYASETVQTAIERLRGARGDVEETFRAYESVAAIITEGRGVGGLINYKGVQLERGFVADEDTTIYNPGLTLLTESEKERLVEAIIQARAAGISANQWNQDNQLGFEFLREKLDPLHVHELRGYLSVFPVLTAIVYLAVLAVQQLTPRSFFPIAYFVGVAMVLGPAALLIATGP